MEPDDKRKSRPAKRARHQYLAADEEECRDVDLSDLSIEADSGLFSVNVADYSVELTADAADCGIPSSTSTAADISSMPSRSFPSSQVSADVLPNEDIEVGTNSVVLGSSQPLSQSSDCALAVDVSPSAVELGDLPIDCSSVQYNHEDLAQHFSRFAVEEPDADLLVQEPDPVINDRERLYAGASLTLMESVTAIMSFSQSEHISGAGLGRLLSLITLHLPKPNNFFKSSSKIFKLLEGHEEPVTISYFCSICLKPCTSSSDVCDICTDDNKSKCMFIHLPLVPQVQRFCNRPHFLREINYRFTRVKENANNIEDIYDAKAYKLAEKQFREGETNLTLTWNTDGLQVYNSSLMSLWPFYFVVNELPPSKRFLTENMLIGGIWCGVSKPHPNLSLKHIYEDLKVLQNGVSMSENSVSKVYVKLLCGTCDAPARAYFLNMKTHSGFYSCHLCLCFGENSVHTEDVTVFPFQRNFVPRTLDQYHKNVQFAVENRVLHNKPLQNDARCAGIKGPSYLSYMLDNLLSSTSIDPMHCLYLGVMRQMLYLFFDKCHKGKAWSLSTKVETINERIKNIQPPHFLDRMPESVDKLVHWKASMFRAFLFHFALCILYGILPTVYFDHFMLLVSGVSLLNSSSVSPEDIETASSLLSSFVEQFEGLYGKRHMSHNVHMLLHLAENVEYLGPLWVTSCFGFEDTNGKLVQLVHGTRHAGLQICSHLSLITALPLMVYNLENTDVKKFCHKLRYKWMQLRVNSKISEGVFCIGDFKSLSVTDHWMLDEISQVTLQPSLESIQMFQRLYKDGILYVSSKFRITQRDSSYVKYLSHDSEELGNIVTFIKLSTTSISYFAVIKRLQSSVPFHTDVGPVRHLHEIHTPHLCVDVVPISSLKTVMFKVLVSGILYLSEPLNKFEFQ